jgi:hypothetical protein
MSVLRWFLPRPVRRVMHPVRSARRAVTPRPVRAVYYARHPIGTATSAVTRRAVRGRRR